MNSRCQFLRPKIYFLLWFLFKKGCAHVMNSSWRDLTAQHYAIKMNSMYARVPGIAQQGVQPRAGSHFWSFHVITILGVGCLTSSMGLSGMEFVLCFPKKRASQGTWSCCFLFQDVKKLVRMLWCPLGQSCASAVTMLHPPSRASFVCAD